MDTQNRTVIRWKELVNGTTYWVDLVDPAKEQRSSQYIFIGGILLGLGLESLVDLAGRLPKALRQEEDDVSQLEG